MVYLDMVNTFKKELKLSKELNVLITWYLSSKSSKIDLEDPPNQCLGPKSDIWTQNIYLGVQ